MEGGTEEQALSLILSSPEYFAHAAVAIGTSNPPSNESFVIALYEQLLGRSRAEISAGEIQAWVNALATQTRAAVALQFLSSEENRSNVVQGYYLTLLNRSPSGGEVASWANSSLDLATIRVMFEIADEFYANG
jgi:hypothetical protein